MAWLGFDFGDICLFIDLRYFPNLYNKIKFDRQAVCTLNFYLLYIRNSIRNSGAWV